MRTITLPDGRAISALSRLDAALLYHEIVTQSTYTRHGIQVADGDCIFDVGANIGLFSIVLGHAHRRLRLFMIEPVPAIFAALELNVARHLGGADARLFKLGLARQPGTAEFVYSPSLSIVTTAHEDDTRGSADTRAGLADWARAAVLDLERIRAIPRPLARVALAALARRGWRELLLGALALPALAFGLAQRLRQRRVVAPLTTISALIRAHEVERVDLLKVDVEGAELDVLLGIEAADWPKIRQLVVEVHDVRGRVGELRRMLAARGYHTVVDQEDWALHPLLGIFTLYAVRQGHAQPAAPSAAEAAPPRA